MNTGVIGITHSAFEQQPWSAVSATRAASLAASVSFLCTCVRPQHELFSILLLHAVFVMMDYHQSFEILRCDCERVRGQRRPTRSSGVAERTADAFSAAPVHLLLLLMDRSAHRQLRLSSTLTLMALAFLTSTSFIKWNCPFSGIVNVLRSRMLLFHR